MVLFSIRCSLSSLVPSFLPFFPCLLIFYILIIRWMLLDRTTSVHRHTRRFSPLLLVCPPLLLWVHLAFVTKCRICSFTCSMFIPDKIPLLTHSWTKTKTAKQIKQVEMLLSLFLSSDTDWHIKYPTGWQVLAPRNCSSCCSGTKGCLPERPGRSA